jgi:hypothetical protein
MSQVPVVNLSYVEVDANNDVQLDTRARFVLEPDGRVHIYTKTENFRDYVLPDLIGGGLPHPDSDGVDVSDGQKYLDTLRQLIQGSALTTSEVLSMDQANAREGFPFEYTDPA